MSRKPKYGLLFNRDISGWDVSSVTDMSCMFEGCKRFNQARHQCILLDAMPGETVDRIWDVLVFERSFVIVFQAALAILTQCESELLARNIEGVMDFLCSVPIVGATPLVALRSLLLRFPFPCPAAQADGGSCMLCDLARALVRS